MAPKQDGGSGGRPPRSQAQEVEEEVKCGGWLVKRNGKRNKRTAERGYREGGQKDRTDDKRIDDRRQG